MDSTLLPLATQPARPLATDAGAAPDVRPLTAITAADRRRVGDKTWHLARLARAGLPVPKAFCICGDAIPPWCDDADQLPPALVAAIRSEYRRLGAPLVAVRSSAADEDQPERSAAGLYASFLNVRGEAAVLAAVFACWQARLAPRATLGRVGGAPAMAVLVQVQVDAEAAGVLFTADPLSGGGDRLVINAVWGLGEPLAAGRVSGDVFHASAAGELVVQDIGRKERMLTAGGERPVPPGRRQRPALTAPQIRRLALLAKAVTPHFADQASIALDIEFAIDGGQAVLLQARPVPPRPGAAPATAVVAGRPAAEALANYLAGERRRLAEHAAALRAGGRIGGRDVVWSAGNVRELLPTPSSFSFGLFRHIFAGRAGAIVGGRRRLGYRLAADAGEDIFLLVAGQPYFNLEIDAATFDAGIPVPVPALIDAVTTDPDSASYPELDLYPRLLAATVGGEASADGFRSRMLDAAARYAGRYRKLLPVLEAARRRRAPAFAALGAGLDVEALLRELAVRLARMRRFGVRFVIAARLGFFFADLLRRRLRALTPAHAERCYASLLQGLPGSRITEQGCDLERLAAGALSRERFLAAYGHMASNELELLLPRLSETPERLDRQVAELRASGRRPGRDFARQERRRRRTEAALRRQFADRSADLAALGDDLHVAQTFLPLRETLKYHLAAEYAGLRTLLRTLAERLDLPDDSLFHLDPQEVLALTPAAAGAALTLAATRRAERELARRVARECPLPPVLFASRLDAIGVATGPTVDAEGVSLAATAIAPGIAEGTVRLLCLDESELCASLSASLPEFIGDEIIVAPSANLGLAPLFRAAAGVVVEVGGVLAHCACQAREAGIPALVLAGATRRLHDGDRIRLDAERGRITILARAAAVREGLR